MLNGSIHEAFSKVITHSPKMLSLLTFLSKAAQTDATILILGETGSGKDLIARSIHNASKRCNNNFVSIHCATIPENLLESELFGYKRGAFTDAKEDKVGKIQLADKGTLFLDEIAELTLPLQAKLLRVIEEHQLERLGDTKLINVDVRIIAATNADIEELIRRNLFRDDLFYRLNEMKVELPPLRERKEDLPLLIAHFIREFNQEYGKDIAGISNIALKFLSQYDFPGNVRELRSIIKRAMIVVDERRKMLWIEDLPLDIRVRPEESDGSSDYLLSLKEWLERLPIGVPIEKLEQIPPKEGYERFPTLKEVEKVHIEEALKRTKRKKEKAAEILGITKPTLYKKIREYNIKP